MPNTQINCPNCRQRIVADIQQLFDVGENPSAKQQLLSGAFNLANCPHCGFQGNLATPIVYHDAEKELLLTFVPTEVGLPRDEQERIIGSLINRVVDRLPQEKRKGYLLQPKANLTMQSLVETILEADGITKEMIDAQQKRLDLLQRMATADAADVRLELLKQEGDLVDADFFNLMNRLMETARLSGDQESAQSLDGLQAFLLENTDIGQEIREQTEEVQAAVDSLREVGPELTRDGLLDIVIDAPTDRRVEILVSLARPGMDYEFFRLLTDRIDRARGKGRVRLIELRDLLLELTRKYDEEMEARALQIRELLDKVLQEENVSEAAASILPVVDEMFLRVLEEEIEAARKRGDIERSAQLQKILKVIEEANEPPPEVVLIEELLNAPDDMTLRQLLEEHKEEITPEFMGVLSNLSLQMEQAEQNPEMVEQLKISKQPGKKIFNGSQSQRGLSLKILHVVGARPNFMKIAPIMREMARYSDTFEQSLVHTGQHYDELMSQVFFVDLDLPRPDLNLDVGSGTHAWQTAEVMQRFEPVVLEYKPDWVVVVGDVNSTLACTLVCSKIGTRVAHVEAGLRSFDRNMPEEINRLLTDQVADLLFTPSQDGDQNLVREGVAKEKIHLVGNVMIDSLVRLMPKAEVGWHNLQERLGLHSFLLVTIHRPFNVDDPDTLVGIMSALSDLSDEIPVLFPLHPRTQLRITEYGLETSKKNLHLLDPCSYLDFLALQMHADLVITDSGGIQEETTYLGVPCLTVRPNTERPVTITLGTNRLVESTRQALVDAVHTRLAEGCVKRSVPPLWDGHTAERIVRVLMEA